MSEPKDDLAQLRDHILEQVLQKRAEIEALTPLRPPVPPPYAFHWLEARRRLEIAARMSQLSAPPQLENVRGPKRWLSLLLGKIVIVMTRFMTNRQIDYNVNLMETVEDMVKALHELETLALQNQEHIRHLESCLTRLQLQTSIAPEVPGRKAG
jgi:hypothetical protein